MVGIKLDGLFNHLNISINEPGQYKVVVNFANKSASYDFKVV